MSDQGRHDFLAADGVDDWVVFARGQMGQWSTASIGTLLMRTALIIALLLGPIATAVAQVEGGPVYAQDKDAGGGARDAPSSAAITDESEPGEKLLLMGTVFAHDGKPREGVTVYAYQTDANGFYRRKPWGRPRLRGWARTDAEGRYEFHTIKPGPYPMRRNPAHVHMTIAVPGKVEWWIPELRFADDSFLAAEEVKREAPKGSFASICPLRSQPDGKLRCVRDIRLPQDW